ncbi:MAG: LamG domain-containing protein, partial [Chloroflexaceae bacterium]|nr:LamG domain-containing protein [Chloroflexaceae bacterium]
MGSVPGSGVRPNSVEVRLQGAGNGGVSGTWQRATLTDTTWSLSYTLSANLPDPSGAYTLIARARDRVNNQTGPVRQSIELDSRGPVAALNLDDASELLFTSTATLNGVITDTGSLAAGVDTLEAAFVPVEQVEALSRTVVLLPFDDAAGAVWFDDTSFQQNDARCTDTASCPTSTVGQFGQALAFDGVDDYIIVPDSASIDFAANEDFTLSAWVRIDTNQPDIGNIDNDIIEKWSTQGGYPYVVRYLNSGPQAGRVSVARFDGITNPTIVSSVPLNDGAYHAITFVKQGNTLLLYIDGQLDGTAIDTTIGDTTNDSPLILGARGNVPAVSLSADNLQTFNHFAGAIDQLIIEQRSLSAADVQALYAAASVLWRPATLDQNGPGVASSPWNLDIPEGLEGTYQLDLRGTDALGNQTV